MPFFMAPPQLKYAIGNAASTTSSLSISNSDTSLPLTSDTNFAAKSGAGMILVDEGLAAEEIAYSTGKSGASLTIPVANRGLEGGSAQAHNSGAAVKGILTAGMWNDLIDSLLNVLTTAGALDTTKVADLSTAQTFSNKTLTLPQINDTSADHQYVFGVSELTADRIVTLPLLTAADQFTFDAFTTTLTNKRITKRVDTVTSAAAPAINQDTTDIFTITAQAEAITSMTTGLTGTPTTGQGLIIRIKDNGTARAITWGAKFASRGATLPTTTVLGKYTYVGLIYNEVAVLWDCVAVSTES